MGMALLVSIFSEGERGRVLGTWSAVGPAMSFSSSFVAGLLIALWGVARCFCAGSFAQCGDFCRDLQGGAFSGDWRGV